MITYTEDEVRAVLESLSEESRRYCDISTSGRDSIPLYIRACIKAGTHEVERPATGLNRYRICRTALGRAVRELDLKERSKP